MKALHWIWTELNKPRGPVAHRFYRVGRSSRAGVALLIVITCFLFLTIMATELTNTASVRIKLAANQRDEARAEQLAYSGLNFYRLILVAANGLDSRMGGLPAPIKAQIQAMGISGDMLWQMVPFINTNLLRMVFVSGGDMSDEEQAELDAQGGLTEEQRQESMDETTSNKPGFLDFYGDFFAEVTDESRRINIKNISGTDVASLRTDPAASQVLALMSGMNTCDAIRMDRQASIDDTFDNTQFFRDRDLEPLELVGNLADWVDKDNTRAYLGGNEDTLYERLDDPYRTKNAPFDTLQEVRLVDGWHRDDVWERYGDQLTVFGDGKVNVNTASCEVLWALLKSFTDPPANDQQVDSCIRAIESNRSLVPFANADAFSKFLVDGSALPQIYQQGQAPPPNVMGSCSITPLPSLRQAITTKTKVFRVTSVGEVNDAKVTVEAVFDFSSSVEGKTLYWRID